MAPKKKKTSPKSKASSEDTLLCRRSSLQVNLSFVSNLSDSGHGSLYRSRGDITGVKQLPELCESQSDFCRNSLSVIAEDTSSVACADQAALSAINEKEQALDQSCKLLKAAILNKTRELFDRKAELCVKTATILSGQRQALKEINDDSKSLRNKTVISKSPLKLGSTSKARSPRLSPESRTRRDSPIPLTVPTRDESFILGGSDESYRNFTTTKKSNKVLRVRLTRLGDLGQSRTSFDSSQCSSLADDIGLPLTCSSFISDRAGPVSQPAENDCSKIIETRDVEDTSHRAESPSCSLTPMEITTVQGAIPPTKNIASVRRSGRVTRRSAHSVEDVPMELTTVQCHIPFFESAGSSTTTRTSLNVNTSADQLSYRPGKRKSEGASTISENDNTHVDRTVHISLRVNTSLGTEESPAQETEIHDSSKTEKSNINSTAKEAVDRRGARHSSGNISLIERLRNLSGRRPTEPASSSKFGRLDRSSLVDGLEAHDQSKNKSSNIKCKNKEAVDRRRDRDSSGNISLIARLRNLSGQRPKESANNSIFSRGDRASLGEGPSFVEGTSFPRRRSSPGKTSKLMEGAPFPRRRSSLGGEPSFIEGTPFPPSRSMLWKTQIRMGTAIRNRTSRRKPTVDSGSDTSITLPHGSVVLDESPSRHASCTTDPRIIPDSSDEDQPAEPTHENVPLPNENVTPNIPRSGKKKLLSLHQNLELISLSPLSPAVMFPKTAITWKPKRKPQKRKAVRQVAVKRIEEMPEKEVEDDSEHSFVSRINTQQEQTKAKKPRRVISKKIVVKKIADLDIIERLEGIGPTASGRESAVGERSSINEFTKRRRLSNVSRNLRAEKVVIVATGFAKSDVDLVKSVVRKLGGAEVSSTVSRRTTHVVSTGVRTINLLRGIIRGCWLVSLDWVLKSSEHGKWLSAEQYEMVHFSKAVQENRRDRQLFGKAYVPELFTTCGLIYIEHGSSPPPGILKELVKTAGGWITEDQTNAKLSVGPAGLKEIWILDSITTGDLQPVAEYRR